MSDASNESVVARAPGAGGALRPEAPAPKFDIFVNSFTTADPAKLGAVARVISAYNAYLIGACGRPLDEITANDVQQLGVILTALSDIEQQPSERNVARLNARPL